MTDDTKPSLLLQVAPPIFLLWPASTTHGPSLYLANGLFGLVGLVSCLRVAYFLLHPDRPYRRLLRPVLAASNCLLASLHTQRSLMPARKFAKDTAARIQAQCDLQGQCPTAISGWPTRNDTYSSQINSGTWVQWPVLYHPDGKGFTIRLYKALDINEAWSGGVNDQELASPGQRS